MGLRAAPVCCDGGRVSLAGLRPGVGETLPSGRSLGRKGTDLSRGGVGPPAGSTCAAPFRYPRDAMSYLAAHPEKHEGSYVGESHQCVAFVKAVAGAPATGAWRQGALVVGNLTLAPGTAIACGWDEHGRYRSLSHGNHAAIYVSQKGNFIEVWDQWTGQPVKRSRKVHRADLAYYVIE